MGDLKHPTKWRWDTSICVAYYWNLDTKFRERKANFITWPWKAPYNFSVRSKRRPEDTSGYIFSGSSRKIYKASKYAYQSDSLPYIQQNLIYDLQRVNTVKDSKSQIFRCLVTLEQCFSQKAFVQRFTAPFEDRMWKQFSGTLCFWVLKAFTKMV